MLECECSICGKFFLRKRSQVILGGGLYCSNTCRFLGRKKGKMVLCYACDTEVYRSPKELKTSKSGKYFCSKKCLLEYIYKKYKGSPNLKSGLHSDYREKLLKKSKGSERCCMLCTEDNLKMLAVHHVDKNRSNNSLKNLIWLCHNCHFLVHHYKEEKGRLKEILHGKKM